MACRRARTAAVLGARRHELQQIDAGRLRQGGTARLQPATERQQVGDRDRLGVARREHVRRRELVHGVVLLDAEGGAVEVGYLATRQEVLLTHLRSFAPDVLITELFPFGRRILRDEFTALLEAAHKLPRPPLICASIRDILAPPSKPKKAAYADEIIDRFYDAVLVHSDPDLTPLELSWPVSDS